MYSPHHHSAIEIELLDHGMIVHYQAPVKKMKNVRRSSDPISLMLEAMMPKILEQLSGTEDGEDWSEEKRAKKDMMQTAIEKAQELMNPKPKECWVWSDIRVVVSDAKDLPAIIGEVKEIQVLAKKIQDGGEYINPSHAQLVAPFSAVGDYVGGASIGTVFPGNSHTPMNPEDVL